MASIQHPMHFLDHVTLFVQSEIEMQNIQLELLEGFSTNVGHTFE